MRLRRRSRDARRRAVLRVLDDLRAPRAAESRLNDALSFECPGRPYVIGPGTLLVALYLWRALHDESCTEHGEDAHSPRA